MDSWSDAGWVVFGSLDPNAITWESGGKTVINGDGEKRGDFASEVLPANLLRWQLLARWALTNKSDQFPLPQ